MSTTRIVIVGAGPAGMAAALTLVNSGLRPTVIDAGARSGGQIYRRPPAAHKRSYRAIYGADGAKARRIHNAFDAISSAIDYRPKTRVWATHEGELFLDGPQGRATLNYDKLILCTGAIDRLFPIPGWEASGCYSLGGAQIALKSQALALGEPIGFVGAGPLLWLVAWQHLKAGAQIAGIWCTATRKDLLCAVPLLALRPRLALRGVRQILALRGSGVRMEFGARVIAVTAESEGHVMALRWSPGQKTKDHKISETPLQALALGWHLRSETQLSQLLRLPSVFDPVQRQHHPKTDGQGRSPVSGIYLAGDGVDILGADAAEIRGRQAARALLMDLGYQQKGLGKLKAIADRLRFIQLRAFAKGLAVAFPPPTEDSLRVLPEHTILCQCENISHEAVRTTAENWTCQDINRIKALTRAGMGRCQGRYCGAALAAVVAAQSGRNLCEIPEQRAQAPIYPLPFKANR